MHLKIKKTNKKIIVNNSSDRNQIKSRLFESATKFEKNNHLIDLYLVIVKYEWVIFQILRHSQNILTLCNWKLEEIGAEARIINRCLFSIM